MATYIRQEIAKYAEVTMKIDFNKFSDRQIKNIIKQLKNGAVSYGHSATATVAKWLVRKYPMPHFRYDSWCIRWNNLPNGHPFFEQVKQAASLAKLQPNLSSWEITRIDETIKNADDNTPSAEIRIYDYDKHTVKHLKKHMVIGNVIEGELKDFLGKMENRELGAIDVGFYDFADSY